MPKQTRKLTPGKGSSKKKFVRVKGRGGEDLMDTQSKHGNSHVAGKVIKSTDSSREGHAVKGEDPPRKQNPLTDKEMTRTGKREAKRGMEALNRNSKNWRPKK